MQPSQADIERHRKDWQIFAKASTWSVAGLAIILLLLWFTVA